MYEIVISIDTRINKYTQSSFEYCVGTLRIIQFMLCIFSMKNRSNAFDVSNQNPWANLCMYSFEEEKNCTLKSDQ